MTAAGVISKEYDHRALTAQLKKVERLVLKPLIAKLNKDARPVNRDQLEEAIDAHLSDLMELPAPDKWYEGFEAAVTGLLARLPAKPQSPLKEFVDPQDPRLRGDPRFSRAAFLSYIVAQFVEKALANRFMVCVAQNGPSLAIVPFKDFQSENKSGFSLPAQLDPFPVQKFSAHWCEELGAERLWLAIAQDLPPHLEQLAVNPDGGEGEEESVSRSNRGCDEEDAPFVTRAIQALDSHVAKNANHAITLLENGLWKEVRPEAETFDDAVGGFGHWSSKRHRLYKKVRAEIASRGQE